MKTSYNPYASPKYIPTIKEKEEISGSLFVIIMLSTLVIEFTITSIIFYERSKYQENSRKECENWLKNSR